jgi:4-aminobutyrate aminotransferase-like enzyme
MLALELTDPQRAAAAVAKARAEGLLLLTCGLHGQVIRLLPPLTITDDELTRGLAILERALN